MTLSVVGVGLVSPAGTCARDHVFFPRAEGPPPAPSPFLDVDGHRLDTRRCAWISSRHAGAHRLIDLARAAAAEALAVLPSPAAGVPVFLVAPAPRPGLTAEDIATLARSLREQTGAPAVHVLAGAAAAFVALAQIASAINARQISGALLVGVDSLLTVETLTERVVRRPSPYLLSPPPPAEGAAAVLVTSPSEAARLDLRSLGELTDSRVGPGRGTDDDDEPVDAVTMTALLRGLPSSGPIRSVFGQSLVGLLRLREWHFTLARCVDRFDAEHVTSCLEAATGELGAAAGVVGLAMAFATFQHGAAPSAATGPLVVWAISRDGTRGLAAGSPAPAARGALVPLGATARARRVPQAPVAAPTNVAAESEPDDSALDDEAGFAGAVANDIAPLLSPLLEHLAPSPLVTLDPRPREPTTIAAFHASMVAHAGELAGGLARARRDGPRRGLPRTEARLLRQLDAIVAAGPHALADVATFWGARPGDLWTAFAGAISAAAFEGDDAMGLIHRAIHALSPASGDHVVSISEALCLSDHPGLATLATELCSSPHPLGRAIGINVRSSRGDLPFEGVHAAFLDDAPPVARAAFLACERLPSAQRAYFVKLLHDRTTSPSPGVARSAARVLAVWGDRALWTDTLDGPIGAHLGPHVAEIFVLCGAVGDWPRLESFLGRHRTTRAQLSWVALFGSPAAGPWLIQRLDDDALADAAVAALGVLFGDVVAPRDRRDPAAWRRALAHPPFDAGVRLRRGRPWSPAVVSEECTSGALSRMEIALRIDELRARCRLPDAVDVSGWFPTAESQLTDFLGRIR
jgi:hypothetical protein